MKELTGKIALGISCLSLAISGGTFAGQWEAASKPQITFGAAGDSIDHIVKRGSIQTTDATPSTVVSVTVPVAAEGIVLIRAHVLGVKTDATKAWDEELIGFGTINGGSFGLTDQLDLGNIDLGTSTYSAQLSVVSANVVGILVTGAASNTVRWSGRIEVELTEETMSGGG